MTANSHNHAPNLNTQSEPTNVELLDAERAVLDVAIADELRDLQKQQRATLIDAADYGSTMWHTEWVDGIDAELDNFLINKGLDVDSENYQAIKNLLRNISLDKIDGEWHVGFLNPDGSRTISGREAFEEDIAWMLNTDHDSDSAQDDSGSSSTSLQTREQYEELAADYEQYADLLTSREKWAEASAKQQGRAFSLKSKERNTIRDDYHAKVREFGIAELEGQISDDEDDLSKNTKVIEYLFKEQAKLRELTTEKLQNTKVGRFVKFMNKGNLGVRLLKGFGVGLVVGAGGAVVLGAAGAAAGAAVAIGASRFVKGYASNDRHRGMTTAQEEFIDSDRPVELEDSEGHSLEERFDEAAKVYNESFKEDTKNEQKKRRKALTWGVGSVALGASVGYAASNVGALGDAKDALHDKFSGWFGGSEPSTDNPTGTNSDAPEVIDRDNDAIPDKDDPFVDTDGDDFDDRNGHALFNPEDISHDARWVEAGEGWYQTFGELGIPQDNWADVLNDAGPKLEAQGWSYFDDASGEWRISHQGRLPNSSLRIIADAAQRDGYTLAS